MVGLERERGAPFAVTPVEPGVRRERREARVGRVVSDVVREHDERVQARGPSARDRDDRLVPELGDRCRRIAGRRGDDGRRPRHGREELPALVERDRVGADLAHVLERHGRRADEAMPDREDRLGDDRERRVVEQVVRLVVRGPTRELSIGRTPYAQAREVTASTTPWNDGCATSRAAGKRRSQAAALWAPSRPG